MTKSHLDFRFAQVDARLAQNEARQGEMETRIVTAFAEGIEKINARLSTTMAGIAGLGASVGAVVAVFLT